jgi:glycosyltransferase involved in cell wall biosynthesis
MSKVLFSAIDVRPDLQQAARALHERNLLGVYYTTFALGEIGFPIRMTELLDQRSGLRLAAELRRRAIVEFPSGLVKLFPWWEIPRTLVSRANLDRRLADALFRRSITGFDRHVARRVKGFAAVYAGNGAAYETFRAAKLRNIQCIYSVRSFHPAFEAELEKREFEKFPALRILEDASNKTKRLLSERRQKEWDMADLIVMHSNVCRDSYAAYGFDSTKVRVIPLGFPQIGTAVGTDAKDISGPLKVLWAGNFSVLKGAHHFLRAIDRLAETTNVEVKVFGKNLLCRPNSNLPIQFFPTVPRAELFAEYRSADVLVHPTLADAYGLVVAEAMSQGLPVITTTRAGICEQIRPGKTGLVIRAGDTDALEQALRWCTENRKSLSGMGEQARMTASLWQWHHYRSALADVLAAIIPGRCPDPGAALIVEAGAS